MVPLHFLDDGNNCLSSPLIEVGGPAMGVRYKPYAKLFA